MPLVILHHLLNVSVQLTNKRGLNKMCLGLHVLEVLHTVDFETEISVTDVMQHVPIQKHNTP
jgi:hypothetical protein